MKTEKEIQNMYEFIGFFNDGQFMNQDFRRGIMAAFAFVLYGNGLLANTINLVRGNNGKKK